MASFPTPQTGTVGQFPLTREQRHRNVLLRFTDGSTQAIALQGPSLRGWVLQYELLGREDMARLEQFVLDQHGSAYPFRFIDPETGTEHPTCRLDGDELLFAWDDEDLGAVIMRITQEVG